MIINVVKKYVLKCNRETCGNVWETKGTTLPKVCPKCHSPKWNDDDPSVNGGVKKVAALVQGKKDDKRGIDG